MGVSPQNSESLNKPGRWLLGIHKFETSMQGGYLWRDMDTTTMTGLNFDGLYQQQGLNTNVLPRFELNSVQSNTQLLLHTSASNNIGKPETDVKMELQEKIRSKYIENGAEIPSLEVRESEPPKPKPKEEDPETIKRRRERNKIAATKCRKRKRERIAKLEQRTNEIRAKRTQLEKEKSKLLRERKDLLDSLHNHCCKFPPSASNFQPGLDASSSNNRDSKFMTLLSQMHMFGNLQH